DADRPTGVHRRNGVPRAGVGAEERSRLDHAAGVDAAGAAPPAPPLPRERSQATPRLGRGRAIGDRGGALRSGTPDYRPRTIDSRLPTTDCDRVDHSGRVIDRRGRAPDALGPLAIDARTHVELTAH